LGIIQSVHSEAEGLHEGPTSSRTERIQHLDRQVAGIEENLLDAIHFHEISRNHARDAGETALAQAHDHAIASAGTARRAVSEVLSELRHPNPDHLKVQQSLVSAHEGVLGFVERHTDAHLEQRDYRVRSLDEARRRTARVAH
jgi:hypothetical protein